MEYRRLAPIPALSRLVEHYWVVALAGSAIQGASSPLRDLSIIAEFSGRDSRFHITRCGCDHCQGV